MKNFLLQIKEDIAHIQREWVNIDENIEDEQYAFNYWVLNHLFNIDMECISDYIVEKSGNGIDCYIHYEDTKELYIIQNKYYSSGLRRNDAGDFLNIIKSQLLNGAYKKSNELQNIFTRATQDKEYKIYIQLYTANVGEYLDIKKIFDDFICDVQCECETEFVPIDRIYSLYFGERNKKDIVFSHSINIKSNKKVISLGNHQDNIVDSKYVALSLSEIKNMKDAADNIGYDLFDENVRDFLGIKGRVGSVNRSMISTLKDPNQRQNFFLYNNGITIICDSIGEIERKRSDSFIQVINPKIVNGCQTTNSICMVIKELEKENGKKILAEFDKIFVLVKFYKIDRNNEEELYNNIVKYTNSQTPVKMDDFIAQENYFLNLQKEFENRGFLLLVKKSDENTFRENYNNDFSNLMQVSKQVRQIAGVGCEKKEEIFIPLDKLLKALIAFCQNGYVAFKHGSKTVKKNSPKYFNDFSLNIDKMLTIDSMIWIYLIYLKSGGLEQGRKERYCIPYYMVDFISRRLDKENKEQIHNKLSFMYESQESFNEIYNEFKTITEEYARDYIENNNVEYGTMTKSREIDDNLIDKEISRQERTVDGRSPYFIKYVSE